jgi:hypothetical protein
LRILAVLQSMWHHGPPRRAPLIFRINPQNSSGRKLHCICSGHDMMVTNSTSICGTGSDSNSPIDVNFLSRALIARNWQLLLICGNQAAEAIRLVDSSLLARPRIFIPHPAARNLTNLLLEDVKDAINAQPLQSYIFKQLKGSHISSQLG